MTLHGLPVPPADRPWTDTPEHQKGTAAVRLAAAGQAHQPVLQADPGIAPSLARRLLDILVALGALLLLWPLLACLGAVARLSTGGSAIYRQLRVGEGGVPFTLLKFRSMRPCVSGPELTAPGDRRITRLGQLLRRTSLDELPQLVNVLQGTMTLVGPRPETVDLARRYSPQFRWVFRYRPGMTGPSQVIEADTDERALQNVAHIEDFYLSELVPRRVAMDLEYLKNPSLIWTVRWLGRTQFYLLLRVARTLYHSVARLRLPTGQMSRGGQALSARTGWAGVAVALTAVVIAAHGLMHLMGVALLWRLGELGQLRYANAVPAPGSAAAYLIGGLWLAAAVLFVTAAVLLVATRAAWRIVALAGVVLSAPVIGLALGHAVTGMVVDGLVLVLVAVNWVRSRAVA